VCQEARGHAEEEDARKHWEAEQLAKEEEERTQIEAEEEEGNRCAVLAKTNDSWQGLGKSQGEVVTEWIREVRQWMKEDSRSLLPQQRPTKRSLSPQHRPRILSQDHNSSTQHLSTQPLSPLPFFSPWGASPPPPHAISLSSALPFSLSPSPTRSALAGCPPHVSSPSTLSPALPANVYSNTLNASVEVKETLYQAYEEEDTCMSYEEEDTCMSYEEEDTCLSTLYQAYQIRLPTPDDFDDTEVSGWGTEDVGWGGFFLRRKVSRNFFQVQQ
jgi:hypothetical protein